MLNLRSLVAFSVFIVASIVNASNDLGGYIRFVPKDAGKFFFVNGQSVVERDVILAEVNRIAQDVNFDIQMIEGSAPDIQNVSERLQCLGAKGAVWIVNDIKLPRVLAAIEDGWAILNVAQMVKDVDREKINNRMIKEMNRTFAVIHGAMDPVMMPACALKPAVGLNGLDALVCKEMSPMTVAKVSFYMVGAGYKKVKSGTYYDACEEGWAPAPTNEMQKAVWDKVHQLPTKPLSIMRESERMRR